MPLNRNAYNNKYSNNYYYSLSVTERWCGKKVCDLGSGTPPPSRPCFMYLHYLCLMASEILVTCHLSSYNLFEIEDVYSLFKKVWWRLIMLHLASWPHQPCCKNSSCIKKYFFHFSLFLFFFTKFEIYCIPM